MSRELPKNMKTPPGLVARASDTITEVREYAVITPLFGGGVEPAQADPITVVRASEVRGQLRFWWRATRGGQFGNDLAALRTAEEALWGGPAREENGKTVGGQSRVQIVVEPIQHGHPLSQCHDYRGRTVHIGDPGSLLSYGTFPLRETREQRGPRRFQERREVLISVVFKLTISFPVNQTHDVQAALWSWETFGGIGARTRRGFGAVKLMNCRRDEIATPVSLPASSRLTDVRAWIHQHLRLYITVEQWHNDIPHLEATTEPTIKALPDGFLIGRQQFVDFLQDTLLLNRITRDDAQRLIQPLLAWYYPIYKLQVFRQSRRRSQHNNNAYGRSYWPEPDEIRARTVKFRGRHQMRLTQAPKFPRAVFGLPIVFKFKDEDIDPGQTTLQGSQHDRLSSQLILRPIACADGSYVAAATLLKGPVVPPGGLKLQGAVNEEDISVEPLTHDEANFPPLNGASDVISVYLNTL